jgi:hypothetical protein
MWRREFAHATFSPRQRQAMHPHQTQPHARGHRSLDTHGADTLTYTLLSFQRRFVWLSPRSTPSLPRLSISTFSAPASERPSSTVQTPSAPALTTTHSPHRLREHSSTCTHAASIHDCANDGVCEPRSPSREHVHRSARQKQEVVHLSGNKGLSDHSLSPLTLPTHTSPLSLHPSHPSPQHHKHNHPVSTPPHHSTLPRNHTLPTDPVETHKLARKARRNRSRETIDETSVRYT